MARITVQRQCWQRWPRVLIAERRNDDGTVDERRYVPEGGTRDEWNAKMRETLRKYEAARKELDVRLHEESELPNLRAEVDGLKWAIEERDALIRAIWEAGAFSPGACYVDTRELNERTAALGLEVRW